MQRLRARGAENRSEPCIGAGNKSLEGPEDVAVLGDEVLLAGRRKRPQTMRVDELRKKAEEISSTFLRNREVIGELLVPGIVRDDEWDLHRCRIVERTGPPLSIHED